VSVGYSKICHALSANNIRDILSVGGTIRYNADDSYKDPYRHTSEYGAF